MVFLLRRQHLYVGPYAINQQPSTFCFVYRICMWRGSVECWNKVAVRWVELVVFGEVGLELSLSKSIGYRTNRFLEYGSCNSEMAMLVSIGQVSYFRQSFEYIQMQPRRIYWNLIQQSFFALQSSSQSVSLKSHVVLCIRHTTYFPHEHRRRFISKSNIIGNHIYVLFRWLYYSTRFDLALKSWTPQQINSLRTEVFDVFVSKTDKSFDLIVVSPAHTKGLASISFRK